MSFMPLRQIADSFDVVKQEVDSRVVTETKCLEGIRATGLPWQIRRNSFETPLSPGGGGV